MFAYIAMFYLASIIKAVTLAANLCAVACVLAYVVLSEMRSNNGKYLRTIDTKVLKELLKEKYLPSEYSIIQKKYDDAFHWRNRIADELSMRKKTKWLPSVAIFMFLVSVFVPTKDALYVGIGAMAVHDVTQVIGNSAVYNKTMELVELKIDAAVTEAKEELGSNTKEVASGAK